ncbi:MAG: ATPase P [Desulfuromonas sp.]|jgi:soluble P-type ATPase|nr:ATPase P [Desulfuromonas sp.]
MFELSIPGVGQLHCEHLLLDCNGTLTCDGKLLDGVSARLQKLAQHMHIEVITADTYGNATTTLETLGCDIHIIPAANQAEAKRDHLVARNAASCIAIGNGYNDALMLKEAAIGIGVIQQEGAAGIILQHADIICRDICDALDLLLQPKRLAATLRR